MATARILSANTLSDGTREITAILVADDNVTILRTLSVSVQPGDDIAAVKADLKAQFIAYYRTWKATRTPLNVGATTIATNVELTG